jgi:hypothetical protein
MFGHSDSAKVSTTNILVIILIVLNVLGLYLLTGNSVALPTSISVDPVGIKKAILEIEYDKVGGKANYDIISKATMIQMTEQIPQMEQYIKTQ